MVIGSAHILPAVTLDSSAYQSGGKVFGSAFCKTNEQSSVSNHPEMDTPSARMVVKNGPCPTLMVNPSENSDRFPRVQFAEVRELDEAVFSPQELVASSAPSVGARRRSDI